MNRIFLLLFSITTTRIDGLDLSFKNGNYISWFLKSFFVSSIISCFELDFIEKNVLNLTFRFKKYGIFDHSVFVP